MEWNLYTTREHQLKFYSRCGFQTWTPLIAPKSVGLPPAMGFFTNDLFRSSPSSGVWVREQR